jgi:predicted O-methyltransferase YrrM
VQRADLIELLRRVPGWLTDDEAWELHEAARTHPAAGLGLTAVELGSWLGRSTVAIATGVRDRGSGVLFAVDPHRGTALHRATGVADTFASFTANVRSAGVEDQVRAIREVSLAARERFGDAPVDLLHVDGSHLYEAVLADIEAWSSVLADAAIVAFHDARDEPGVARAVAERVATPDSHFHDLRLVDNLLLTRFRRDGQAADSVTGSSTAARSM